MCWDVRVRGHRLFSGCVGEWIWRLGGGVVDLEGIVLQDVLDGVNFCIVIIFL
jgi:hypothetical protein